MEKHKGINTYHAKNRAEWRKWLMANYVKEKSVWLIIFNKSSGIPSIYYEEAVEEALCFGWVDSKPNTRDHQSHYQFFTRRKPGSNWSKLNKAKVERLIKQDMMTPAGMEVIEEAKKRGTWDALSDVENLVIPKDLGEALDKYENARQNFGTFPRSVKRGILEWIFNAQARETRKRRIEETAALADKNERANQYRPGK
ncbi:MAG TPA: YdeI family protein [Cyclobacteriaceae bacterium]